MKQPRVLLLTMRSYLLITLILSFCLSSCSQKGALQIEAEGKAQQWFENTVIKCGDDYFVEVTDALPSDGVNGLYQLKNPSYTVEAAERHYTESDKLNDEVYEWEGAVFVHSTQYRRYILGWGSWREGTPTYNPIPELTSKSPPLIRKAILKKHNKWNVDSETESKLDCPDIPQ
jgi:hypothetical protein